MSAAGQPVIHGAIDVGMTASKGTYSIAVPIGNIATVNPIRWGQAGTPMAATVIGGLNTPNLTWGWDADTNRDAFRLFKLMLDSTTNTAALGELFQLAKDHANRQGQSGYSLMKAYLERLWNELNRFVMTRQTGRYQLVFTIPGMWMNNEASSGPKANMLRAIRDAGIPFNEANFCPEAFAALLDFEKCHANKLQPGNVVIVCDVGGGTIDAVGFQIGNNGVTPTSVQNTAYPISRAGGSIVLDSGFLNYARGSSDLALALKMWQRVKTTTNGEGHMFVLDVALSKDMMTSIFGNLALQVYNILNEQMTAVSAAFNQPLKYIYLAGGVAANQVLQRMLLQVIPNTVELIIAHQPDLAVTRGGLIYAQKFSRPYVLGPSVGPTGMAHLMALPGGVNSVVVRLGTAYSLTRSIGGEMHPIFTAQGSLVGFGNLPVNALQRRGTELEAFVVETGWQTRIVARLSWALGSNNPQNISANVSVQRNAINGETRLTFVAMISGARIEAKVTPYA